MTQLMSLNHTSSGAVAVASEKTIAFIEELSTTKLCLASHSVRSFLSIFLSVPNKTMFQFRPPYRHQWRNSPNRPLVSRIQCLQKFRFAGRFFLLPYPHSIVPYHLFRSFPYGRVPQASPFSVRLGIHASSMRSM